MKKILTAAFLTTTLLGFSQEKLENSLLWKVSGEDIKTSYIYGTMHATCNNDLTEHVKKALKETKDIYLELDMDDSTLQMKMMQQAMMPSGITIQSLTTKEDYKILDAFLTQELGMGIAMFNSMKPMMISSSFIPKMLDCPMKSIEGGLMAQIKSENEEVYGLETLEDQFAAFDAIPYKEQVKDLIRFAKEGMQKSKDNFQQLLTTYKSQNIEKLLGETSKKENGAMTEYLDDLLTKRNKNWIPKIITTSKKKRSFYAVGAAHLAGETGVIKLLRRQGYSVEAIK